MLLKVLTLSMPMPTAEKLISPLVEDQAATEEAVHKAAYSLNEYFLALRGFKFILEPLEHADPTV